MPTNVELLINQGSRSAKRITSDIIDELEKHDFEVTYTHHVNRRTSLNEVIRTIQKRKPSLLIVCSGDGTISTLVSKLVGYDVELGLIPLGTTNNFARSLMIPLGDISAAISIIKTKAARPVDLGKINGEYFTNVAGIGLSAHIANSVSDGSKARWGRLAYAITGLSQMLKHPPFTVVVQDPDRELSVTFETRQVIVANGRYHAGKEIAQDAKVNNGELLIFTLGGPSIMSFIKHMIDFYAGKRKKVIHSSYFIGRKVEIRTNRVQPIELDGEVKLQTPVTIEVETAAVKVRY